MGSSSTPTTSTGTTPSSGGTAPQQQGGVPNPFLQQMMSQALSGQAPPQAPPPGEHQQLAQAEVLYQSQLEQLANMGFTNRQANLRGTVCHVTSSLCHVTSSVRISLIITSKLTKRKDNYLAFYLSENECLMTKFWELLTECSTHAPTALVETGGDLNAAVNRLIQ